MRHVPVKVWVDFAHPNPLVENDPGEDKSDSWDEKHNGLMNMIDVGVTFMSWTRG